MTPRFAPPLALAAAVLIGSTVWAAAPAAPAPPAAGSEIPEPTAAVPLVESEGPDLFLFDRDPIEVEAEQFLQELLFQRDDLYDERTPLPPETETAALLADTPARADYFGESERYGGLHVLVSRVTEEDGERTAILQVHRKKRRADSYLPAYGNFDLFEWWRLNDDGSVTFLRAKTPLELEPGDLPPAEPGV